MTGTSKQRRRAALALGLLAALCVGWSLYWFYGQAKLKGDVEELRSGLAQQGLKLTCGTESWGGFPFRFELTCTAPSLQGEHEGKKVDLRSGRLQLFMQAYNPFHIIGLADGPTTLNGIAPAHGKVRGSLVYDTQGNWDAALEIPAVDLPAAGKADMLKLFARVQDGKLQLAADAANMQPARPGTPAIAHAEVVTETDASLLLQPDPLQALAMHGTPVTITTLTAELPAVTLSASGSFALDAQRKLNGKLASEVSDLDELMALLAPELKLSDQEVAAAKAVIGLIGGGTGKARKIDVIAKAGELYFGPFKIADVPPLE